MYVQTTDDATKPGKKGAQLNSLENSLQST